MKKIWIIFGLLSILTFNAKKILAQEDLFVSMPMVVISTPTMTPMPTPTPTPTPTPILLPTIVLTPTVTPTVMEEIGVTESLLEVKEECNPNICHPLYGCTMNRCLPTDPIQTNCTLCGPLGLGYDMNCDGLCVTPTPKLDKEVKIIFIPGYGASWNTKALVLNQSVYPDSWKMLSFAKNNYFSFETLMQNNGYVLNRDYFVWNYDWRRPVSQIVSTFSNFYNARFNDDDKVMIVGHSLGGLVARIFAHDYPKKSVQKVITVGSPHRGALRSYDAWAWGSIDGGDFLSRILRLYIEIRRINSDGVVERSKSEAVQLFAPMVRDILPEYDFLKFDNHLYDHLLVEPKNYYLIKENQEENWTLDGKLVAIMGTGGSTKEYVDIGKGWKRIYDYNLMGDGTVLTRSAGIGNNIISLDGQHANLINDSIGEIAKQLNLNLNYSVSLSAKAMNELENEIIFFAYPDTSMTVECDDGKILEADQYGIIMVSKENKQCKVRAIGLNGDLPKVLVGRTDFNADWMFIDETEKDIKMAVLTTFRSTKEEFEVLPLPEIVW